MRGHEPRRTQAAARPRERRRTVGRGRRHRHAPTRGGRRARARVRRRAPYARGHGRVRRPCGVAGDPADARRRPAARAARPPCEPADALRGRPCDAPAARRGPARRRRRRAAGLGVALLRRARAQDRGGRGREPAERPPRLGHRGRSRSTARAPRTPDRRVRRDADDRLRPPRPRPRPGRRPRRSGPLARARAGRGAAPARRIRRCGHPCRGRGVVVQGRGEGGRRGRTRGRGRPDAGEDADRGAQGRDARPAPPRSAARRPGRDRRAGPRRRPRAGLAPGTRADDGDADGRRRPHALADHVRRDAGTHRRGQARRRDDPPSRPPGELGRCACDPGSDRRPRPHRGACAVGLRRTRPRDPRARAACRRTRGRRPPRRRGPGRTEGGDDRHGRPWSRTVASLGRPVGRLPGATGRLLRDARRARVPSRGRRQGARRPAGRDRRGRARPRAEGRRAERLAPRLPELCGAVRARAAQGDHRRRDGPRQDRRGAGGLRAPAQCGGDALRRGLSRGRRHQLDPRGRQQVDAAGVPGPRAGPRGRRRGLGTSRRCRRHDVRDARSARPVPRPGRHDQLRRRRRGALHQEPGGAALPAGGGAARPRRACRAPHRHAAGEPRRGVPQPRGLRPSGPRRRRQ